MRNFSTFDRLITNWMARNGIDLLRYSVGIVFIWFGALKFFPGMSPAEDLALSTISLLTFDLLSPQLSQLLLALFEVTIGVLLCAGIFLRFTILLLLFQMAGTMTPVVLFPELVFASPPFILTIEGQYIFKNVVLISAALVIGATVRGGKLSAEPALSI